MSGDKGASRTTLSSVSSRVLVARLVREDVSRYTIYLVMALVCMAFVAVGNGLMAWLVEPVINDVFVNTKAHLIWPVAGAILLVITVKGIAKYAQGMLLNRVGTHIIADLQNRLFAHLMRMEPAFFDKNPIATLVSRFTVDIRSVQATVSSALAGFGIDVLSLVCLCTIMIWRDPILSLVSLAFFPLCIVPIIYLSKRVRKSSLHSQEAFGHMSAQLQESFRSNRMVRIYGREEVEKERVQKATWRLRRLEMKIIRFRSLSSLLMELLIGLAMAAAIVYGGYEVLHRQTDVGRFMSFLTALLLTYGPFKRLMGLYSSIQTGLAGAARLYDLLDTAPQLSEASDAKPLHMREGDIAVNQLQFHYHEGQEVLRNINLHVPAGSSIALVGESGSGKTTLLNLLARFYDPSSGTITIGGQDISQVTFSSLYGAIAMVSQEVLLINDTIYENIIYGCPQADEEAVIRASKAAFAHDFIMGFPQGYDTRIGEDGVILSGGQRQRIAIARAIVKEAPILLLDEATSALDSESEKIVQVALHHLMQGRTCIIIAHRLSTVIDADKICVLREGKIIEEGTHAALLERGGYYTSLYRHELR